MSSTGDDSHNKLHDTLVRARRMQYGAVVALVGVGFFVGYKWWTRPRKSLFTYQFAMPFHTPGLLDQSISNHIESFLKTLSINKLAQTSDKLDSIYSWQYDTSTKRLTLRETVGKGGKICDILIPRDVSLMRNNINIADMSSVICNL